MTSPTQHTVGLLLFPRFQLLAYVMATETLRLANKVAGHSVFRWETLSQNGAPVAASNGVPVVPSSLVANAADLSLLLLCAGYDPLAEVSEPSKALLRKRARLGGMLGGIDTGTVILAELGLLAGYRAVVHFEAETGFRETYPEISLETAIYALDRERLTAAGGTATGDAMLAWIAKVDLARSGGQNGRSSNPRVDPARGCAPKTKQACQGQSALPTACRSDEGPPRRASRDG